MYKNYLMEYSGVRITNYHVLLCVCEGVHTQKHSPAHIGFLHTKKRTNCFNNKNQSRKLQWETWIKIKQKKVAVRCRNTLCERCSCLSDVSSFCFHVTSQHVSIQLLMEQHNKPKPNKFSNNTFNSVARICLRL